jgi:aconitase A
VLVEDHERFVDLIITEFKTLHADNVVRFGIRPLEFKAWQDGVKVSNG